jgi:ubiquinone/menaquinone biosynthesis C-methylase UbiE
VSRRIGFPLGSAGRAPWPHVDKSGRAEELVDLLGRMSRLLGKFRQESYEPLRLHSESCVLDVGCGAGEACVELAAKVGPRGRVAGVDLSVAMAEAARRAAIAAGSSVELCVAGAYELPFPAHSFDAVRAQFVFQHVERPEAALAEMLRVTRPGGRIMVIDPDHGQLAVALDDPAHIQIFEALRHALLHSVVNPHSGTRLRGMFVRAGLAEIEQVASAIELDYPIFVRAFSEGSLASAVGRGEIRREESDAFAAMLEERHRAGTFLAIGVGYSAVGTRS